MIETKIEVIGKMPPFYQIAETLWGKGVDVDSDGNSNTPQSTDWNELTLILRSDTDQRIDIDPLDNNENYLLLRASNKELSTKTMAYLKECGVTA